MTTKAATSVTSTSAKLNGTLNPNGQATTCYFDYGTTTSYGSKTSVGSVPAGHEERQRVGHDRRARRRASITSASWHRARSGTTVGDDLTFGSAGPPVVQTGSAQGASTSGVTLTGSVNPGGTTDQLVLRVRPDRLVRDEDAVEERRLRHRGDGRLRGDHQAHRRDDLPLPARRDEQRRHDLRQRRHVHDGLGADLIASTVQSSTATSPRSRASSRAARRASR